MGPIRAVVSCYANIVNFSGRARRAEYWWFFLFVVLAGVAFQVGLGLWVLRDPDLARALQDPGRMQAWIKQSDGAHLGGALSVLAYVILAWLPQLSVTVRRLHDTDRSGWLIFVPALAAIGALVAGAFVFLATFSSGSMAPTLLVLLVPVIVNIWFLVLLCLPGTHGPNRFGPNPIKGGRRRDMGHPAFASHDPEDLAELAARRKAEISDYYRKNVLAGITRP